MADHATMTPLSAMQRHATGILDQAPVTPSSTRTRRPCLPYLLLTKNASALSDFSRSRAGVLRG